MPLTRASTASICRSRRAYSASSEEGLKEALARLVPEKRELLKKVKALGDKKLGEVKVENALGGMR